MDEMIEKYLGETVYIKRMDIDGLIWIKEVQVARITINFNIWGSDSYVFHLDPDFGHCKSENFWIKMEYIDAIFLSKQECLDSIYKDIYLLKEENPELKKSAINLKKV